MAQTTSDASRLLKAFAALLTIPVLMMVVGFPLMQFAGGGHGPGGGMGAEMLILPAIPLTVLVGVAYYLYTGAAATTSETADAQEELRAAYARGDLTEAEFERRRDTLQSTDATLDDEVQNSD